MPSALECKEIKLLVFTYLPPRDTLAFNFHLDIFFVIMFLYDKLELGKVFN